MLKGQRDHVKGCGEIQCFINKETIREICSQLIDPVFNAVKTLPETPVKRQHFSRRPFRI